MTDAYVELHGRSAFSFLEGASMPEAMAQQAANLGMPALGILDRDGLYGAPRLYMSAKKLGLRSHIGAEISVAELGNQVLPEPWQPHTIPERPVRLALLCESQTGYCNLSQLITGYKLQQKTKGEGFASLRSLRERSEGLVCLTGGDEGPLASALARGGMDEGRRMLGCLVIVEFCRKNGILVQGRGSAANSAVCYSLGITAVDPVGMELLFERFLSEVRGEWPDIDLDLPSGEDRERAIQYVYTRYGQLGAAMCANVITYRGRSAAREVGKSLGFDEDTLTRLTRLVGSWEWKGPTDTMQDQFRTAGFDLNHPRIAKYLELSIRMLDLPRHLGQHSGA